MVERCSLHVHLIRSLADEATVSRRWPLFWNMAMPFAMLKKNWPGTFRRTITIGKKGKETKKQMVFEPGVPVELSSAEAEALRPDIGIALVPIEFDEKARPRVITDDVIPESEEVETPNEPQSSN